MAIYDLSSDFDKRSFNTRVKYFLEHGCRVELSRKTNRTRAQNSYLHLIIGYFAMETGERFSFVKEEYFKKLCNPDLFITKKTDIYMGETIVVRSSRELSIEQMSLAITRFRNWAADVAGIYIPSSEESEYLSKIEQDIYRNNNQQFIY